MNVVLDTNCLIIPKTDIIILKQFLKDLHNNN